MGFGGLLVLVGEVATGGATGGLCARASSAAGPLTSAFFNPALAASVTFHCSGHTLLEYAQVYWLGPLTGKACRGSQEQGTQSILVDRTMGSSSLVGSPSRTCFLAVGSCGERRVLLWGLGSPPWSRHGDTSSVPAGGPSLTILGEGL